MVFVALVTFTISAIFLHSQLATGKRVSVYSMLALSLAALLLNGRHEFLERVPIGNFPEKDFYYVYPDASTTSQIIDSRWSIYGRADLVQYSSQDLVRQLFIDGAAGTQVYRFNGHIQNTRPILQELLLHHTNAIPFLCLTKGEKRSMLVIGPGGGKEVLLGLFGEADTITGVEINPDFVQIVKDHRAFDGGIYSDFPNVKIVVEEGRHFVKQSNGAFDLIVMALPSTAQMQNIEPFATSENYLLTREAIADYLKKLTSEGKLILTVHNGWELTRLITTVVQVFQDLGVSGDEIRNHFVVFEAEYAPTVVIKKNAFTLDETCAGKRSARAPSGFSHCHISSLWENGQPSITANQFLGAVSQSPGRLRRLSINPRDDISPCTDDRPYFYKVDTGVPKEYIWLLAGAIGLNVLIVWLPLRFLRRKAEDKSFPDVALPLTVFMCTGMGFMILEVSLFQKLVLYLGSPTISLSMLLSSLLVGMGTGSYFGRNMYGTDARKRLQVVSMAIVVVGIFVFVVSPFLLARSFDFALPLRAATTFLVILPLAFLLGIPFPSCIELLALDHKDRYIPWMYGVNGSMSVLGSVLAVILSMLFGFTPAYFVGLAFYASVLIIAFVSSKKANLSAVAA